MNDPWTSYAIRNYIADLTGPDGLRPSPVGLDDTASADLVAAWSTWADREADHEGLRPLAALQRLVARSLVVDGESVLLMRDERDGLTLQLLGAERLDAAKTTSRRDGTIHVWGGVETTTDGRVTGYYIIPASPDSPFGIGARESVRFDRRDVIHVYDSLGPGQLRGLSHLAPAILPAADLSELQNAMLVSAKTGALFAGFIRDSGDVSAGPDLDPDSDDIASMEPGTVVRLPAGTEIDFSNPQQNPAVDKFMKGGLLQLSAGLGVPSYYCDNDLSNANYSSIRAGLLPYRAAVAQLQQCVLVPALNRIWRRWQALEYATGRIDVANTPVRWIAPRIAQVDPAKSVSAEQTELELGLISRAQAVESRGRSLRELDDEIARSGGNGD